MNKNLFIICLGIFFSCFSQAQSQDMIDNLSNEICDCLEKEKITSINKINPCFEKVIVKHLSEIYKVYNIESIDDFDSETFGAKIGVKLMKECDYLLQNMTDSKYKFDEDFVPEESLDCSELKTGEFFYLMPSSIKEVNDTTFVTIKNKMFMERMNSGHFYSLLDIDWIDECKFDLIFKESNDPIKSHMSKLGDKYRYEIVSRTSNSYLLKLKWRNQIYKIELFFKK